MRQHGVISRKTELIQKFRRFGHRGNEGVISRENMMLRVQAECSESQYVKPDEEDT
jgi:hypothetical protein